MTSMEGKDMECRKVRALEAIAASLQRIVDRLLADEDEDYK